MTANPREGTSRDAVFAELTQTLEIARRRLYGQMRKFSNQKMPLASRNGRRSPLSWAACHGLARRPHGVLLAC
jgi:hypothetical protein